MHRQKDELMPIIHPYTPSKMVPDELEQMFISKKGREVFNQILDDLERRIHKSSNQHYLILGRRGIGKSHLMGNIYYAITKTPILNDHWFPVWLSEEEYSVTSIRDLGSRILEKILNALSGSKEESDFKKEIETFKKDIESHDNNEDIFKLTTSFIKDLSNLLRKRFVVIIENFNLYLKSINSHQEKILRSLLMHDTALLFITSAPTIHTYLTEVADPKNALYNLFDVHYLGEFSFEECRQLLIKRCLMDNNHLCNIIETEDFKLKPVYIVTGGNPRLMLLFYRLIDSLETIQDVKKTMVQLLDQLTPYFQGKMEGLPDQQRKILVEFTNNMENLTPAEIGKRIHLRTNQVTAQVGNLVKNGFINIVDKEGNTGGTLYELSERTFRYWYRYRNGKDTQWLSGFIEFISSWVSLNVSKPIEETLKQECKKYQKVSRYKQLVMQGIKLIFSRKYQEASDTFNLLPQIYQDDITFLYKFFASIYLGNYEQAISYYTAAIKLNNNEFRIYSLISIYYLSLNESQNAMDYLNKGLDRLFDQENQINFQFLIKYMYFVLATNDLKLAYQVIEVIEKKIAVIKKKNINVDNCIFLGLFKILINFLITSDKNLLDRQPFEIRQILKEMSFFFLEKRSEKKDKAKKYSESPLHFRRVIDLILLDFFKDFMRDYKKDEKNKQIKILTITASPDDADDIFYEQEQDTLLNAFQYFDREDVYLDMPDPVKSTLDEIQERLSEGKHDILHITAHGSINDTGEGGLFFEDHWGKLEKVTGSQLAEVLQKLVPPPLIVILSSSHSARPEPGLMSTARALFNAGITAVIGMDKAVSHAAAIEFNAAFFTALCEKKTITEAFGAGKEAISNGEQRRLKENPGWNHVKEYEIPQLLTRDEHLAAESFSNYRIEAPDRPQSHYFQGVKYLERGFIGRRRILRDIFNTIANKEGAVVLKGPGGIGKSTLTTRIAANLLRKGYDFIIIRGDASEAKILESISNKAAEKGVAGAKEIYAANAEPIQKLGWYVENFLGPGKVMVIFDNFEENLDEAQGDFDKGKETLKEFIWMFRDYLKNKESFLFFSTRYTLPGFEGPDLTKDIPEFTVVEFRKMLWNGKALKRLDGKSIGTLKQEIGGNPRALELLDRIAYIKFNKRNFNWEELALLISGLRKRIIDAKNAGDDFTPLFLGKLINYLSPAQRLIMEALSIYRNPVVEQAVTVQGVRIAWEDYQGLIDLSLLEYIQAEGSQLYYVHRLTAQYILVNIEDAIRNKYHLQAGQYFEGIRNEEGMKYIDNDIESRWHYLQAREWDHAAVITFALGDYLTLHGFPQRSMGLLRELEDKELSDKNRANVFHLIGMLLQDFGNYDAALIQYQKSLEIKEKIGDIQGKAISLHQIGMIYEDKGEYDAALMQYQQSLEIEEKIGDIKGTAASWHQIGMIYENKGDYDAALRQYQQSLEIFDKIGDSKNKAASLHNIGAIYQYKGDYDAALTQYQQSLEILEKIGDIKGKAINLHNIAAIYQYKGNYDIALMHCQKSLKIADKIGDMQGKASNLHQIGMIYEEKGDYDAALSQYQRALEIAEKIGDIKGISSSLHQIGNIYYLKGGYDAALIQYQKSLEIKEKIGDIKGKAQSLHQIGMIYEDKGDYDAALTYYQQALEIFEKIGDIQGKAQSLHQIGNLYYLKGDYTAALTYYQQSLEIAEKIGDIAQIAISMGQMGKLYFNQYQFETALKLFCQAFVIFTKIGAPYANQAKELIARCREKMTEEQFKAILKEFGMLNYE